jgi:Glycosyl transferases group 1
MRVGLFTYHDESSTAAYLRSAIGVYGDTVVQVGLHVPHHDLPAEERGLEAVEGELDALLFVDPPGRFWPAGLAEVGCPTAAYLIDTHQNLGLRLAYAPFFDHIFVAQRDDVPTIRTAGYRQAEWLPLAAEPAFTHDPLAPRPLDVAFVGQTGQTGTLRYEVLRAVTATFKTNDIGRRYAPAEMADLYGQAKIVINASVGGDVNMRVFEAMVSGALLVTDRVSNGLDRIFTEGEHYVGYDSFPEAEAVIARYLDDDAGRTRIAATAQQHVLAQHTYLHRWMTIRSRLTAPEQPKRALASATPAARRRAYAQVCSQLGRPDLVWHSTRPWLPRWDSPSNLRYTALALGKMINRVVPITPNAVRARTRKRPKQ